MKKFYSLITMLVAFAATVMAENLPLETGPEGSWNKATQVTLTDSVTGEEYAAFYWKSQYGELGGSNWGADVEAGTTHIITVKASRPLPQKLQWKLRYKGDSNYSYPGWNIPEGEDVYEVSITLDRDYDYIAIQSGTNSGEVYAAITSVERTITLPPGIVSRNRLPIIADANSGSTIRDPEPGLVKGENGLPAKIELPSNYGSVTLWNVPFDAHVYPAVKVVLAENPGDTLVQLSYGNVGDPRKYAAFAPGGGNTDWTEYSEDGREMTLYFDLDWCEDNDYGETVKNVSILTQGGQGPLQVIVEAVYLIDEDGNEVPTEGLAFNSWNPGKEIPMGGSYDDEGNIFDAFVSFNKAGAYLGAYSNTLEENTYEVVTFTTAEPLDLSKFMVVCQNMEIDWANSDFTNWNFAWIITPVACEVTQDGNDVRVEIGASYGTLCIMTTAPAEELPLEVRFTNIKSEVREGQTPVGIAENKGVNNLSVRTTQYFNAAGQQVNQLSKGLNIIRETMSDGTVRAKKVMVK